MGEVRPGVRGPPHFIEDLRPFIAIKEFRRRSIVEGWDVWAVAVALEFAVILDREVRRKVIPQDLDEEVIRLARDAADMSRGQRGRW